ncbi:Aspartate/tyrosine/aromatic aminotransferase [Paramagnetospirillum magneticum AMB-1]|uniref:Aspartate/tyrosine/aromatic aminotransferase n=1 Tax=Paramagnetospirillum magneticum (strain ATCC 700264 / AMB-1) TaxID=342108 RepID=Q2W9H7_PARM1|nr:Aspartate/tyrosine/aromatic aminotransferase [Paramagnetospirillum magneticum AMB-1]
MPYFQAFTPISWAAHNLFTRRPLPRYAGAFRFRPGADPLKPANAIFSSLGTTIFETMSRLAQAHGAVNLGQGFPEGLEPADVVARAAEALVAGPNQYPSMMGTPDLRQAIARHERRFYGTELDPMAEVMVTSGATEALADCLFGLIEPGDEVVLIEPLYDSYLPIIRRAGGIPKLVRVEPPHWDLPRETLAAAFSPRTKLMILNTPMNPSGKVWSRDEMAFVAGLLERFDAYCVCDEVYEHLVYDGRRHLPLMTLPGMRERCLKIGSAGKIFSLTGWKVGWVVAAPDLLAPLAKVHQYLTFATPPNLQSAVAWGLDKEDSYYDGLAAMLAERRDRLAEGLRGVGFEVMAAGGSYFLTADFRPLGFAGDDDDFCRHITEKAGVAAIPISTFYQGGDVDHFARFCFAKTESAIDEAVMRLRRYFKG